MKRFVLTLTALTLLVYPVGAKPELYFSPEGGGREAILRQINLSRQTIDLAIFDFTAGPVALALAEAAKRGVRVRIVADRRQAAGKHSEIPYLTGQQVPIRLLSGKGRGIMHHKFAVFDAKAVSTGSYNWTENAEHNNYENLLIEDAPELVTRFHSEFDRLWSRAEPLSDAFETAPAAEHTFADSVLDWLRGFRRYLKVVQ